MRCSVAVVAVDFLVTEKPKRNFYLYIYYIYNIYINKPIFQCSSFQNELQQLQQLQRS